MVTDAIKKFNQDDEEDEENDEGSRHRVFPTMQIVRQAVYD